MKPLSDLRWVRLFDPLLIPKGLLEQINGRDFEIEDFIKYQQSVCAEIKDGTLHLNPYNLLFVLADPDNRIQGVVWLTIDGLTKSLNINIFSLSPEYWHRGQCVELLKNKCLEIMKGAELKKIRWCTKAPKHSKKHGFKESRQVLMEYTEEEDGRDDDGQRCQASGASADDDAPTTKLS